MADRKWIQATRKVCLSGYSQFGLRSLLPSGLDCEKLVACLFRQVFVDAYSQQLDSVDLYLSQAAVNEHTIARAIGCLQLKIFGMDFQAFWREMIQSTQDKIFLILGDSPARMHLPPARVLANFRGERGEAIGFSTVFGHGLGEIVVQQKKSYEIMQIEQQTARLAKKRKGEAILKHGGWGVCAGGVLADDTKEQDFAILRISAWFGLEVVSQGISDITYFQRLVLEFLQNLNQAPSQIDEIWLLTPNASYIPFLISQFDQKTFPRLGSFVLPAEFCDYHPLVASFRFLYAGASNRLLFLLDPSWERVALIHLCEEEKACC